MEDEGGVGAADVEAAKASNVSEIEERNFVIVMLKCVDEVAIKQRKKHQASYIDRSEDENDGQRKAAWQKAVP